MNRTEIGQRTMNTFQIIWKTQPGILPKSIPVTSSIKRAKTSQSDEVKGTEYHLWEKIKKKSSMGRRTGVGITAEGVPADTECALLFWK